MKLQLTCAALFIAAATTGCVGTHTKTASIERSETVATVSTETTTMPVEVARTDSTMSESSSVVVAETRTPVAEPQAYTPMDNSRSSTTTEYSTTQAPVASSNDNYEALAPRADRN